MSSSESGGGRVKNSAKTTRIRTLLEKRALKNQEFAEELGFSIDTANKLSSGSVPLTLDKAKLIADKYNVSLDWLYERSEDTNDDAGRILLYLEKFFKIRRGDGKVCDFIIEMDEDVKNFLLAVDDVRKIKETCVIPARAVEVWIDEEKRVFNEKYKATETKTVVEYPLSNREQLIKQMPQPPSGVTD